MVLVSDLFGEEETRKMWLEIIFKFHFRLFLKNMVCSCILPVCSLFKVFECNLKERIPIFSAQLFESQAGLALSS